MQRHVLARHRGLHVDDLDDARRRVALRAHLRRHRRNPLELTVGRRFDVRRLLLANRAQPRAPDCRLSLRHLHVKVADLPPLLPRAQGKRERRARQARLRHVEQVLEELHPLLPVKEGLQKIVQPTLDLRVVRVPRVQRHGGESAFRVSRSRHLRLESLSRKRYPEPTQKPGVNFPNSSVTVGIQS